MELHQLEYFVAVAEEANFTRAAERLRVAQPGVSAQIRKLERELGQQLLDRSGRAVRLTEAGGAVLPHARMALAAVAGVRTAADEVVGLLRGRLAVGVMSAGPAVASAERLAEFHVAHPGVEITLTEADSAQLINEIRSTALDLAIVGLADEPPADIETQLLRRDPIAAAVGADHSFAGRSELDLTALRDTALLTLPRGHGMRVRFENACTRVGFTPRIAFETSNLEVLSRLTAAGLGVAILPEPLVALLPTPLDAVPIRPVIHAEVAIARRARGPHSPAARAFLAAMQG